LYYIDHNDEKESSLNAAANQMLKNGRTEWSV